MIQKKNDWWAAHWPKPQRKKENWETLTPEQIIRYNKELASDNFKKYLPKTFGDGRL